jgi:hypothetical protein
MTREEFLKKYPLPWDFEQTDPSGTGVITDANDQTMAILKGDLDWDDEDGEDTDPKQRPVFDDDDEGGEVVGLLLEGINGEIKQHPDTVTLAFDDALRVYFMAADAFMLNQQIPKRQNAHERMAHALAQSIRVKEGAQGDVLLADPDLEEILDA